MCTEPLWGKSCCLLYLVCREPISVIFCTRSSSISFYKIRLTSNSNSTSNCPHSLFCYIFYSSAICILAITTSYRMYSTAMCDMDVVYINISISNFVILELNCPNCRKFLFHFICQHNRLFVSNNCLKLIRVMGEKSIRNMFSTLLHWLRTTM